MHYAMHFSISGFVSKTANVFDTQMNQMND